MKKNKFEPIGVSVTSKQKEWIQEEAIKRNQNVSVIVREAIDSYKKDKNNIKEYNNVSSK
jgi:uncharacterized membrane-anchored protein YitT (DUF2179 family)